MLTVPKTSVRDRGNQGKQRPHYLLLSHVPRACSAEAWAGSEPPEGATMDGSYTTQAHPFHFVPKVAGALATLEPKF